MHVCVCVCANTRTHVCGKGEGGGGAQTEKDFAPSNENSESAVPATAATVTVAEVDDAADAADMRHSTVVPLTHDDVAQSTDATAAVGVRSLEAKAMPLRVAVAPPEEGALSPPTMAQLRAGAF